MSIVFRKIKQNYAHLQVTRTPVVSSVTVQVWNSDRQTNFILSKAIWLLNLRDQNYNNNGYFGNMLQ